MSSPHEQDYSSAKGLHRIEDDLIKTGETLLQGEIFQWREEFVKTGIKEIEEWLGKKAAFAAFLESYDQDSEGDSSDESAS